MQRGEMIERTKQFALRVIRLVSKLPKDRAAEIIGRQLLRSGTSIGANYREAVRAATKKGLYVDHDDGIARSGRITLLAGIAKRQRANSN
jgi:hypothetical protein